MSNDKNSEHKVKLSFDTTLWKIKNKKNLCNILQNECINYITAYEMHSQSKSFQITASHASQLNM